MATRRDFLKNSGYTAAGALLLPAVLNAAPAAKAKNVGIQLYSVRKEMLDDATGTLKKLAAIGYKELESAKSTKGNYYGLSAKEIKKITHDLGMNMRSGHVHIDKDFQQSIDAAAEAGQEYLVCSSLPFQGQTISNYEKCADAFSKAATDCKKSKIKFGYHNHDYEFDKVNGKVLYDILLDKTDPAIVTMEMDIGWVIMTGNDPLACFNKYPGRFPLWHLKDMDPVTKHSTEFGKGKINIASLFKNTAKSGMKYFFVEQEEYTNNAFESIQFDYDYLMKI